MLALTDASDGSVPSEMSKALWKALPTLQRANKRWDNVRDAAGFKSRELTRVGRQLNYFKHTYVKRSAFLMTPIGSQSQLTRPVASSPIQMAALQVYQVRPWN